jgi:3-isopropylmalate dehydrogenase
MVKKIAVLAGDGIGPEVMSEALRVLKTVLPEKDWCFEAGLIGGAAYEKCGKHFPEETLTLCKNSDAILFGSVGGPLSEQHLPKWQGCESNSLLSLRKAFKFHANLRPITVWPALFPLSPLKESVLEKGVDLLIVRELLGDCYFGDHHRSGDIGYRKASDVAEYTEDQIKSIAEVAFNAALKRRKKVCSVHKANVLATSQLWRDVVRETARNYPDVTLEEMLVDNCAMQIVREPSAFDVIVTTNMFGDILSDIGAVLPGSLGVTPSASLNKDGFGMYEPSGGSAPDIVGQGIANPIAQILSAALLLRHSFQLHHEAEMIESAVAKTIQSHNVTPDLLPHNRRSEGCTTKKVTDEIISFL